MKCKLLGLNKLTLSIFLVVMALSVMPMFQKNLGKTSDDNIKLKRLIDYVYSNKHNNKISSQLRTIGQKTQDVKHNFRKNSNYSSALGSPCLDNKNCEDHVVIHHTNHTHVHTHPHVKPNITKPHSHSTVNNQTHQLDTHDYPSIETNHSLLEDIAEQTENLIKYICSNVKTTGRTLTSLLARIEETKRSITMTVNKYKSHKITKHKTIESLTRIVNEINTEIGELLKTQEIIDTFTLSKCENVKEVMILYSDISKLPKELVGMIERFTSANHINMGLYLLK